MDPTLLSSIIALGGLGLIFGVGLAYAAQKFAVKVDPKVEQILQVLPGANCGACGQPGCSALLKQWQPVGFPPTSASPAVKIPQQR